MTDQTPSPVPAPDRSRAGRTETPATDQQNHRIEVKDGTVLTIDVLTWNEDWDFGCPVCVLRPALAFSPNGEDPEEMAGSFAEEAAFRGYVEGERTEEGMLDRQYPVKALKRRWADARRGVEFPVRRYSASRFTARFYADHDGLTFDLTEVPA